MTASETPAVRIGVVGAGFMGRQHIDFIRAAAGASWRRRRPGAPGDGVSSARLIGSTAAMLDAEQLDAVIIANPNPLHVETASNASRPASRCSSRSRSPWTTRSPSTRRRRRPPEWTTPGRPPSASPPAIARARSAIHDGELGEVVAVSGLWSARKEDAYFTDTPWHREPGAGVTLINVVHDLDLLRHLCGEVAEIQAMRSSHARGLEVEDTVSLNLRFESGAVGKLPRLRRRGLAVGLGPGHRGDAGVPIPPRRRRLPDRGHARRPVGAEPREVRL